jgi:anti-sigma regulatory factor (Ser/Thr protein kinase)
VFPVQLTVAPGVAELERGLGVLAETLHAARVDDGACFRAQLVFEEIVTNAFRYAFVSGADGQVDVTIDLADDRVTLAFMDRGLAFDPLSHVAQGGDGSLDGEPIGGRGLLLVRKACRALRYEHRDGCNLLQADVARA